MNTDDGEYDFLQSDFFKKSNVDLDREFRMKRTENPFNIIFDVKPKVKSDLYKNTIRLKIKDVFPEFL